MAMVGDWKIYYLAVVALADPIDGLAPVWRKPRDSRYIEVQVVQHSCTQMVAASLAIRVSIKGEIIIMGRQKQNHQGIS